MASNFMFSLLILIVAMMLSSTPASSASSTFPIAKPGCDDHCGNVRIPFPFGIREGCYLNETFFINCTDASRPLLRKSETIKVTNISLEGQLKVLHYTGRNCYRPNGSELYRQNPLTNINYNTFNSTANKFFAVGCDTFATVTSKIDDQEYTTGCVSSCSSLKHLREGKCSGIGCCQTSIPSGTSKLQITLKSFKNHTKVNDFNPCSYAFVAEEGAFNFSIAYLTNETSNDMLPILIDWTIGNGTCEEAKKDPTSYACQDKSECFEPEGDIVGYRCSCKEGFIGNPYLRNGCQDIDECEDPNRNNCTRNSACENLPGSYKCSCHKGYHGDGREGGEGCTPNQGKHYIIIAGVATTMAFLVVVSFYLYFEYRRRKTIKLKEKFFRENGGLILQQKLIRQEGSSKTARIFTAEELKRATSNYDQTLIIGQGGFGTVYKGFLADNSIVAIKKSKIVDRGQIEQFINEVIVLSQINHRNVVKLLGCCLETEVPSLVYEFINNGTLHEHIHQSTRASSLSWDTRLRIAAETAGVLSYLHSAASPPIIHRDVKSANVLLDDNYNAKVSDFGASKLVPLDQMQLATMVQGTLGYLDPEYIQTSQLTEKSDVYSFGVVLVELLTRKKVVWLDGPEEERCLAKHFLSSMKDGRLFQILDHDIVYEANIGQLKDVGMLAKRCLHIKGDDRPSMKEVAMELEGLLVEAQHLGVPIELDSEENNALLDPQSDVYVSGDDSSSSAVYDSKRGDFVLPVAGGR